MELTIWIFLSVIGLALLWGLDRHLALKDVEKDLKIYLGDVLIARDVAEPKFRAIYATQVSQVKQLIRSHFKI